MRFGVVLLVSGVLTGIRPAAAQSKDPEPTLQQLEVGAADARQRLAALP